MIKKLIKHGNSTALILDKAILKLLNIDDNSSVKLEISGKSILITPVREDASLAKVSDNKIIQEAFEEVMKQYAPALKKLAKN